MLKSIPTPTMTGQCGHRKRKVDGVLLKRDPPANNIAARQIVVDRWLNLSSVGQTAPVLRPDNSAGWCSAIITSLIEGFALYAALSMGGFTVCDMEPIGSWPRKAGVQPPGNN